jgi:hypothetical protein
MLKHILIIFSIALTALSARADEWKGFIGYSGLVEMPQKVEWNSFPNGLRFESRPTSNGTQFEIGIRNQKHEWYIAYHQSRSPDWNQTLSDFSTYPRNDSVFSSYSGYHYRKREEQRVLIGYRLHPRKFGAIEPLIGVALSMGSTNELEKQSSYWRDWIQVPFPPYGVKDSTIRHDELISEDSYRSELFPGAEIELGVSRRIYGNAEIVFICQTHFLFEHYNSKRNEWFVFDMPWNDQVIIMPSLLLQLRYTFGR